jgi:hypothetical protein
MANAPSKYRHLHRLSETHHQENSHFNSLHSPLSVHQPVARCNSANQPRFPGPLIFADQPLRLQQQKCSAKPLPTLCCVQVSAFLPRAEVETTYHFHAKAL